MMQTNTAAIGKAGFGAVAALAVLGMVSVLAGCNSPMPPDPSSAATAASAARSDQTIGANSGDRCARAAAGQAAHAESGVRAFSALRRHARRPAGRYAAWREDRRGVGHSRRVPVRWQFIGDPGRGRSRRRHARNRGIERRHAYHRQLGREVRGGRQRVGRTHERRRLRSAAVRTAAGGGGRDGAGQSRAERRGAFAGTGAACRSCRAARRRAMPSAARAT